LSSLFSTNTLTGAGDTKGHQEFFVTFVDKPSTSWLLLGNAVNVAAAQEYLAGRHADDLAIREQRLQRLDGGIVVRIVERRHHDAAIGDVKVDV
jgi:hypothetical protein